MDAPPTVCFDLMRDPRVAPDITGPAGPITLGQSVTFAGKFFGFRTKFTVRVIEVDPPKRFVDEMTSGFFVSFVHAHDLISRDGGTTLRDTLTWRSPFGFLGRVADKLVTRSHLRALVTRRNALLKRIAGAR